MPRQKFYVVWKGRTPGVYKSWDDCRKQTEKFPDAKYKSFKTQKLAEEAFKKHYFEFIDTDVFKTELSNDQIKAIGKPILESISVDGAWNTSTGIVEYQGVYTKTKELIFRQGPFEDGTNNIVEFLAIVHALAYCKSKNVILPIYSDSRNAIGWVKQKEARTNHQKSSRNEKLFDLIERAEKWLHQNSFTNKILKWETKAWGENPADFGRK